MTYDPNAGGQGQPYGGDPYQKDPYGAQPAPGQGQPADPTYGAQGGGYGAPQPDPYGQPADPYGQQQPDPYGQPTGDPYGQQTNQYGQPDPYGQQSSAPPYGQPDPYGQGGYGQPSGPPYGQPSAPPFGQPSGAPYGTPPPPPQKSRTGLIVTLVAIGVVVLLAICGGGGYLIYAANQPGPKPTPSQSAGTPSQSPSPSPSPSESHDISSRATDPNPVTTDELFPRSTVTYNGRTFTKLAVEAPPTCTKATSGTATTLIQNSTCSQVLRATYVDNTGKYVATVGIANMADEANAKSVGDAIFNDPNKGFWTPLKVPGTAAANFNNTSASVVICSNKNRGHYIGWSIVARADGGNTNTNDPPAKDMGQGLLASINLILATR